MRRFWAVAILGLATAAVAAVPVAPATQEVIARATEVVRTAFSKPAGLQSEEIAAKALAIGPRLWAASAEARKPFKKETKDTYGVVQSPELMAKWKLSAVDLASVPDAVRPTLAEAAKDGTPVLSGAITSRVDVVLPALVLSQVKGPEFPFSVRRPTETELEYYYALIPYDLSEPILVVESGTHAFLCHFDAATKLFFIEML
jgi:hypothetical protein